MDMSHVMLLHFMSIQAVKLYPEKNSGWPCEILLCSAIENTGLDDIWSHIKNYMSHAEISGYLKANRSLQNMYWFEETIKQTLTENFKNDPKTKEKLIQLSKQVEQGLLSPFEAADLLFS